MCMCYSRWVFLNPPTANILHSDLLKQCSPSCEIRPWVILYLFFSEIVTETCDHETFTARCPYSQQILITGAQYGHMALGKCLTVDFGHFGCAADITDIASSRCNGKQRCEIDTGEEEIRISRERESCLRGLLVYMEISHACIPGENANSVCGLCFHFALFTPLITPSKGTSIVHECTLYWANSS